MKIPQAWSQAGSPSNKATASTKVEARIDMSAEVAGAGLCPDCKKPMQPMTAGPVDTMTCMGCRISLPTADPTEVVVDDAQQKAGAPSTYNDQ